MHSAITQCNADGLVLQNRGRSDTYGSVDSLLSNEDCSQTISDRKSSSSDETDPGYVEMDKTDEPLPEVLDEVIEEHIVLDDDKKRKIIQLAEFYLSDEQVLKDVFLLKHVKRNKEGYMSLKLLSSFKKMKSATKDWREVAVALRDSQKLQVNESGSKVRRRDPLPDYDETSSSRVVLAYNLPFEKPTVGDLMGIFSKIGDIISIRIANPGAISTDIKKYKIKHRALGSTVCAIVEYDSFKSAAKCAELINSNKENNWRQMQVIHVAAASKVSDDVENADAAPKRRRVRPKHKLSSRLSESSGGGYSTSPSLSSSDVDQPSTASRPSQRNDSPNTSRRPQAKHVKSNSYSDSRNSCDVFNGFHKRLNSKLVGNGRRHSEGTVLGDTISRERRRAASLCFPLKPAVKIIRNPLGPDGTNGFRLQRNAWFQSPIIEAC